MKWMFSLRPSFDSIHGIYCQDFHSFYFFENFIESRSSLFVHFSLSELKIVLYLMGSRVFISNCSIRKFKRTATKQQTKKPRNYQTTSSKKPWHIQIKSQNHNFCWFSQRNKKKFFWLSRGSQKKITTLKHHQHKFFCSTISGHLFNGY
jgi:hypothetical protein